MSVFRTFRCKYKHYFDTFCRSRIFTSNFICLTMCVYHWSRASSHLFTFCSIFLQILLLEHFSLDFLVYFSHRLVYCGNIEHFVCKVDTNPLPLTPYTPYPLYIPLPPLPPFGSECRYESVNDCDFAPDFYPFYDLCQIVGIFQFVP